jgi:Leucine-rich repeat (LRR) protein
MIAEITGLETLVNLGVLNLERNLLTKITGLKSCKKLETLIVSSNRLGGNDNQTCIESLEELKQCPELHTLDVQKNHLEDPALLDEIFCQIQNLSVLYVNHN